MAVELEHPFNTARSIDESFATILDLSRVVPCVEGGSVLEATDPNSVRAQIKVKMGAMSMTFTGTVEIVEQDPVAHRAVMSVESREAGGQGYANATVVFALVDGGGTIHTNAQITRQGRVDGRRGRRRRARRADHRLRRQARRALTAVRSMATITMRRIRDGEVPFDGGTAIQEDVDRPVFRGNGPDELVRRMRQRPGRLDASGADDQEGPGSVVDDARPSTSR